MKTKRMKKLMMSMGLSRNQVNSMVQTQRIEVASDVSNKLYFLHVQSALHDIGRELLPYVKSFVISAYLDDENTKRPARAGNTDEPKGDGFLRSHHPEE